MYLELASFKNSIKREASAYSTLKDERYFDKFQRALFITAKSHDLSEILDLTYTQGPSPEEQELFEAKQIFMYKVFNETLLTDMGRTKVRKYLKTTDAQAVWKEHSEYMTTSSKGASEKRKLSHYLTNTVLDSQFRGTTQQFVLHFNEQFRRLDDLTDISERMPQSIKIALLQNAVKDIPQLSIVETLLMNIPLPPVEMDHSHTSTIHLTTISLSMLVSDMMPPKHLHPLRGEMFTFEELHETHFFQDIDTPPDDFYQVHQTKHSRKPPHDYLASRKITPESLPLLHQRNHLRNMMDLYMSLLRFINSSVLKQLLPSRNIILRLSIKMVKKRGIHVNDVTDVTDHELSIAETNISEEQTIPHQDDDAPEDEADPILDYINSQHHQEEDMNHALQTYNIMTSPFSGPTPKWSINSVHTHLFTMLLKQNKLNMFHLLIGEPMVDLQGLMKEFSQYLPENVLSLV